MKQRHEHPDGTIMFWVFTDEVIENSDVLEAQFRDLLAKKFSGMMGFVRASRYGLEDPLVLAATKHAQELCHQHDMAFWYTLDPRLPFRYNNSHFEKGLEILMCGEKVHAEKVPHCEPVEAGRFNVRCDYYPRQTHMSQDVAINYAPIGIERVYAFPTGLAGYAPDDIKDITDEARFFFNARDGYVEAFGRFTPPDERKWQVMAFFRFGSTSYDFSNETHFKNYLNLIKTVAESGVKLDGLTWDEPGYYTIFGQYPISNNIEQHVSDNAGLSLNENLWKLVLPAADNSHILLRNQYFHYLQTTVVDQHRRTLESARKHWGDQLFGGIHYTWHFESADMADMNHGAMDIWRSLECLDGGYTDLGSVNYMRDPNSEWYANVASMFMATATMAKFSSRGVGYINLWTVGHDDGTRYQNSIMNHCVNLMNVFNVRWLAHTYGPVGLLGDEEGFLGSDYLPGYPNHSTWDDYTEWDERLLLSEKQLDGARPFVNILAVFPVESMYARGDWSANPLAMEAFKLNLWLMDNHYLADWVSPSLMKSAKFDNGKIKLGDFSYDKIIFPHAAVIPEDMLTLFAEAGENILFGYQQPTFTASGKAVSIAGAGYFENNTELGQLLNAFSALRPAQLPDNTWYSLIENN
ncbi:hypothetical protein KAH55_07060, partial [bacterium]|nr:hypothetical protein [bacterium]